MSVSAAALARAAEEGVDVSEEAPPVPVAQGPSEAVELSEPMADNPFEDASAAEERSDTAVEEPPGAGVFEEPFQVADDTGGDSEDFEPPDAEISGERLQETPAEGTTPLGDEESDVKVEFDQTNGRTSDDTPPPMKRVQVSNQMDILAELEGLRQQATMGSRERRLRGPEPELDIDALLAGSEQTRELRQRVEKTINSDVFRNMRGLQVAIRIQDARGETIHSLEPVSLEVGHSEKLERLSVRFTVDLENHR
jgi:hypothetical protein